VEEDSRWRKQTLEGVPPGALVGLAGPTWQLSVLRFFVSIPEAFHISMLIVGTFTITSY
jgi:hypothetical protein